MVILDYYDYTSQLLTRDKFRVIVQHMIIVVIYDYFSILLRSKD